jgi:hypothetical protein
MRQEVACSLVMNVTVGDVPILEHTIPHILSSHKIEFAEVIVVVDELKAQGRILEQSRQYSLADLFSSLEAIRERGYEFRQISVDYGIAAVRQTFYEWFGNARVGFRCAGGTPIYAFLYGLDQSYNDFRLHLDCDMLIYDPRPQSWVEEAVRVIEENDRILFVNQGWGPCCSDCAPLERKTAFDMDTGQRVAQTFSTRCFLFSMSKLRKQFLPMKAAQHPFPKTVYYRAQGRSPFVPLEQMIAHRLDITGMFRCELDRSWGYSLHAWDKQVFNHSRIGEVIRRIQDGRTPNAHCGQYNLNYSIFLTPESVGDLSVDGT